jgi:dTDP-4-amino-4,6-dideoxygalactose transaminase
MTPAESVPSRFTAYPLPDYRAHRDDIQHALQRSLELGHYILGSEVAAFEQEFASFVGVAHSIGVASGTDAIELLLRALDIQQGSSVAVSSQTAVASVSAIVRAGARPLFVYVDPVTFTMCPESLDQAIHSPAGTQLKAVLPFTSTGIRLTRTNCAACAISTISSLWRTARNRTVQCTTGSL